MGRRGRPLVSALLRARFPRANNEPPLRLFNQSSKLASGISQWAAVGGGLSYSARSARGHAVYAIVALFPIVQRCFHCWWCRRKAFYFVLYLRKHRANIEFVRCENKSRADTLGRKIIKWFSTQEQAGNAKLTNISRLLLYKRCAWMSLNHA